jgi:MFS transporter, PAT family, beta-lactamase induction signal transducer AmpG
MLKPQWQNPKWLILIALYVSQYIPLYFLMMGMPVFMRQQGIGLTAIGLTYLVILPMGLKFLWAPLIDRYSLRRFGHYRFWILLFQTLAIGLTVAIAFVDMKTQFPLMIQLMLLLCTICTTQDIAADALTLRMLTVAERGVGNGIQKSGNYAGAMVGAGLMLLLLDRVGWQRSMLSMAVMLAVGLIPILGIQEAKLYATIVTEKPPSYFKSLKQFFGQAQIWPWLIYLSLNLAGVSMAYALLRPLLVDRGLSLELIGLIFGIISLAVGAIGALLGGVLIARFGRQRSLVGFGILQVVSILALLLPASGVSNLAIITGVSSLFCMACAMAETIIYTLAMDRCKSVSAGSDFTLQVSVMYLMSILLSALGGVVGEKLGYGVTFWLAAGLTGGTTLWGAIGDFTKIPPAAVLSVDRSPETQNL